MISQDKHACSNRYARRMWMKRADGNYVNINTGISMVAAGSASTWTVKVGANVDVAAGTFVSEADAKAAIAKITQGVDPATLV